MGISLIVLISGWYWLGLGGSLLFFLSPDTTKDLIFKAKTGKFVTSILFLGLATISAILLLALGGPITLLLGVKKFRKASLLLQEELVVFDLKEGGALDQDAEGDIDSSNSRDNLTLEMW